MEGSYGSYCDRLICIDSTCTRQESIALASRNGAW